MLAEEVLREMPDLIVQYMTTNNILPKKMEWHNVDEAALAHENQ
jgi:hypothetical protein